MPDPVSTDALRVIAHNPSQTSIVLWIEARGISTDWHLELEVRGKLRTWWPTEPARELAAVVTGEPKIRTWSWLVEDLEPSTEYRVVVVDAKRRDESAEFITLPTSLDQPFTILAASCYSVENDGTAPAHRKSRTRPSLRYIIPRLLVGAIRFLGTIRAVRRSGGATTSPFGLVGHRYQKMYEEEAKPNLKILLGDQVYLDTFARALAFPSGSRAIETHISRVYHRTWDSLGPFLRLGANVCISDDHEYWNNYPRTPFWPGLWSERARVERWQPTAKHYFQAMQHPPRPERFDIIDNGGPPTLSFFAADTRINRDASGERFMSTEDFAALVSWVSELTCPGVLALGQPLITGQGNGRDAALPDFGQYAELCQAITGAPQDLLILAGDVHFGRVASVEIGRENSPEVSRIHEVVSSPLSLVSFAGNYFSAADNPNLSIFPHSWNPDQQYLASGALPGEVTWQGLVRTTGKWKLKRCVDHFMTLRFQHEKHDSLISVQIKAHLIAADGAPGPPQVDPGFNIPTLSLRLRRPTTADAKTDPN